MTTRDGRPFERRDRDTGGFRRQEHNDFRRDRRERPKPLRPASIDPVWHRDVGLPPLPETAEKWRLFVALQLPSAVIDEIGECINAMPTMAGKNVRWTPRENVHLTLLFLGDTPIEMIDGIKERLADAASRTNPLELALGEPGAFPSFHSPKILWVGLQGDVRQLVQLQGRVEGSLKALGFEPEKRSFKPHITVGRVARDLERQYEGDVGFSWRRSILPTPRAKASIGKIHLLRSHRKPFGAVYESTFSTPLGQ